MSSFSHRSVRISFPFLFSQERWVQYRGMLQKCQAGGRDLDTGWDCRDHFMDISSDLSDNENITQHLNSASIPVDFSKGCSRTRDIFFYCIFIPCQNLTATLPTMQLNHRQFTRFFGCVELKAANVALSLKQIRGLVSSLLSTLDFFFFYDFFKLVVFRPNQRWLKWPHLRTFVRFHAAPSGATKCLIHVYSHAIVLPKTFKQTSMCKIHGVLL